MYFDVGLDSGEFFDEDAEMDESLLALLGEGGGVEEDFEVILDGLELVGELGEVDLDPIVVLGDEVVDGVGELVEGVEVGRSEAREGAGDGRDLGGDLEEGVVDLDGVAQLVVPLADFEVVRKEEGAGRVRRTRREVVLDGGREGDGALVVGVGEQQEAVLDHGSFE